MPVPASIPRADLPERIWEVLDVPGRARCMAYNRYGTLLAVGSADGSLSVWDCDTAGAARTARPHAAGSGGGRTDAAASTSGVTSLAWSPCGRYVASGGGADHTVALLDVQSGSVLACSPDLGAPVVALSFVGPAADESASAAAGRPAGCPPPRASTLIACFPAGEPAVVDVAAARVARLPAVSLGDEGGGGAGAPSAASLGIAAVVDPARRVIFCGALQKALVAVVDAASGRVLDLVRLPGGSRITSLTLTAGGGGHDAGADEPAAGSRRPPRRDRLLASCHDRTLRVLDLAPLPAYAAARAGRGPGCVLDGDGSPGVPAAGVIPRLTPPGAPPLPKTKVANALGSLLRPDAPLLACAAELCQAVDRTAWRGAGLSDDGGFVAAAAQARDEHAIFIWPASASAAADRVLQGPPRDAALTAAWRPAGAGELATIASTTGRIYLWGRASRENWAAFAPGFRELAENEEYVEREDEFDREPAPESPGPGGVRRPAGAAPDDEGTDAEVELGSEGGGASVSPTVSGGVPLVRLPPEVWPDEEGGGGGPAPMDATAAGNGGGG